MLKLSTLLFIIVGGVLWRLGGYIKKLIRRIGVAVLLTLIVYLATHSLFSLATFPIAFGVFSIGYGKNSVLIKLIKNDYITRYGCGFLYSLSYLPKAIILGSYLRFGVAMLVVTTGVGLIHYLTEITRIPKRDIISECLIGALVISGAIFV